MGELARRLDARDLWISRGHLWAAATGTALVAVIAFSLGVLAGGGEEAHASGVDPLGLSQAPDDSLVELLARVEASSDPSGGVSALTFPDALRGQGETIIPEAPRGFSGAATARTPGVDAPIGDEAPVGEYTLVVSRTTDAARARALRDQLRGREIAAWVATERVDGKPSWRVCVGGYPTEAAASEAALGLATTASDLPVLAGAQIVSL